MGEAGGRRRLAEAKRGGDKASWRGQIGRGGAMGEMMLAWMWRESAVAVVERGGAIGTTRQRRGVGARD